MIVTEFLRTIMASNDFDYVFVTGHYQTMDVRGRYDAALPGILILFFTFLKINIIKLYRKKNQRNNFGKISNF